MKLILSDQLDSAIVDLFFLSYATFSMREGSGLNTQLLFLRILRMKWNQHILSIRIFITAIICQNYFKLLNCNPEYGAETVIRFSRTAIRFGFCDYYKGPIRILKLIFLKITCVSSRVRLHISSPLVSPITQK